MKSFVGVVFLGLFTSALIAAADTAAGSNDVGPQPDSASRDGQHDFDFDFGR